MTTTARCPGGRVHSAWRRTRKAAPFARLVAWVSSSSTRTVTGEVLRQVFELPRAASSPAGPDGRRRAGQHADAGGGLHFGGVDRVPVDGRGGRRTGAADEHRIERMDSVMAACPRCGRADCSAMDVEVVGWIALLRGRATHHEDGRGTTARCTTSAWAETHPVGNRREG